MTGFGEIPLNWLILTSYKKKCLSLLYFCPYSPIPVLSISLFPYLCSFPYSCSIPSSCSIPVPIPPFFLYPLFQPLSLIPALCPSSIPISVPLSRPPFNPFKKSNIMPAIISFWHPLGEKYATWNHRLVNFRNLKERERKKT